MYLKHFTLSQKPNGQWMTFVAWANICSPTQWCNLSHSFCLEAWIKCWHSDFMHTQAFGWVEQRVSLAPAVALSYSHADYYGLAQISFHCESCKRILDRIEIRHLFLSKKRRLILSAVLSYLIVWWYTWSNKNIHNFKRFFESIYIGRFIDMTSITHFAIISH